MKTHRQDEMAIARQAAEWFTALEDGEPDTRAAFAEWLKQSPVHVREFLNVTAVHRLFDGADAQRQVDVGALLKEDADNVVVFKSAPSLPSPASQGRGKNQQDVDAGPPPLRSGGGLGRGRWKWTAGIAAAVALVAVSAWLWLATVQWQTYSTAVGEQRSVELEDGSLVYLSAQSQLKTRFDGERRELRLLQGEALFTVQRDPNRPFRVHAGDTLVQAVGTQFNVKRRTHDTTVAVIEGAVRVKDVLLTAGKEVRVAKSGGLSAPLAVDAARVTAWRERRLVFHADTLEDMAAEFNRYNRAPKIRIEVEDIGRRRFTGVLDANHPESLRALLAETDDLSLEEQSGELIIHARQ